MGILFFFFFFGLEVITTGPFAQPRIELRNGRDVRVRVERDFPVCKRECLLASGDQERANVEARPACELGVVDHLL